MAADPSPASQRSLFVAGGSGFIGARVVKRAVDAGFDVSVLARSPSSAAAVTRLGARPIDGDLLHPGPWQQALARSAFAIHLAQPPTFGERVTAKRAEQYRADRLRMDRSFLDVVDTKVARRVVYVGGTSYYGDVGENIVNEDVTPQPKGFGPYIADAILKLVDDVRRGVPLVVAFPGYVYGDGSWFREYILDALRKNRPLTGLSGPEKTISPVHVDDCARALLWLLEHGDDGRRYFLVDDRPTRNGELGRVAAKAMGVVPRVRRVPPWLCRLLIGPIVTDSLLTSCALSNARLKSTGFTFEYPTIDAGIPAVVKSASSAQAA